MRRHQWTLGLVCIVLVLTMFGAMALTAETGNIAWLVAVQAVDGIAILWFAVRAPESWRE